MVSLKTTIIIAQDDLFFCYQKMANGYWKIIVIYIMIIRIIINFPWGKEFDPCMRLRQRVGYRKTITDNIPDGTCGLHSIEKVSGDCCDSAATQRMWSQTTAWKSLQSHARSNSRNENPVT